MYFSDAVFSSGGVKLIIVYLKRYCVEFAISIK